MSAIHQALFATFGAGSGGDPVVAAWEAAVIGNGGTFESDSVDIATSLMAEIRASTFANKIKMLWPLLGSGINAAVVPLIDGLSVGPSTNVGFVDADFDQTTGLQGNGTSKILDSKVKPSQLGAGNNGGLGWWELDPGYLHGGVDTETMGINSTAGQRFCIDLRSGIRRFFCWGSPGNSTDSATASVAGNYYGQRSSATVRDFYMDGTLILGNTSSDAASDSAERNMALMGNNIGGVPNQYAGRCAAIYMTDGTLSPTEIADLHTLLDTYLITPTGR